MKDEIERRGEYSRQRLSELQEKLSAPHERWEDHACVYVIGSYGRLEASDESDLDLFIGGRSRVVENSPERAFSRLEETRLMSRLIDVGRELKFPDFSGDGEHLKHHAQHELIGNTGTTVDDSTNTLTARLLLLLESQCVLGAATHQAIVQAAIDEYWGDYGGHETDFVPGYLINDILRLWRTFCVNYEARTESAPLEKKLQRKVKNYKLRHSRLLTCFSGLLFMMAKYLREQTVSRDAALQMVQLAPIARIRSIAEELPQFASQCERVVDSYDVFLTATRLPKSELLASLRTDKKKALPETGLSDAVFDLINALGEKNKFHRMMMV